MTEEKIVIDIKDEDLTDVNDFTPEELEAEDADWKAKATERTGIAKRRTTQLKKAKEAIEAYKVKIAELTPKPTPPEAKKGLDLSQEAYLKSSGITEDYFDKVEEALPNFGGDLKKLLANKYFKSDYEEYKTEKTAREAAPEGGEGGSSGGENTVEYWLKKGGMPPIDFNDPVRVKLRADIARAKK